MRRRMTVKEEIEIEEQREIRRLHLEILKETMESFTIPMLPRYKKEKEEEK